MRFKALLRSKCGVLKLFDNFSHFSPLLRRAYGTSTERDPVMRYTNGQQSENPAVVRYNTTLYIASFKGS